MEGGLRQAAFDFPENIPPLREWARRLGRSQTGFGRFGSDPQGASFVLVTPLFITAMTVDETDFPVDRRNQ
jgi:hypothetical protein